MTGPGTAVGGRRVSRASGAAVADGSPLPVLLAELDVMIARNVAAPGPTPTPAGRIAHMRGLLRAADRLLVAEHPPHRVLLAVAAQSLQLVLDLEAER